MIKSNQNLERAVIGACLLDRDGFPTALSVIGEEARTFTLTITELAWNAMLRLDRSGQPIDIMTVAEELKTEKHVTPADLVAMANEVSSAANVEAHAAILVQHRIRRDLEDAAVHVTKLANDPQMDAFEALDACERKVLDVGAIRVADVAHIERGAMEYMQHLEQVSKSESGLVGIDTGWQAINRRLRGWQPGRLYVIAARPGMGKTAYMLRAHLSMAQSGIPSAIFSLEMPRRELVGRLVCMVSGVSNDRMKDPKSLTQQDWRDIAEATEAVSKLPLYIYDRADVTVEGMRSMCRRLKREHDIQAVSLDYIQLATGSRERGGNREQEVASITRQLKALAKDINAPVIALSQLSRAVEARADKRPQLSDLRESGGIEQDADVVQFLFRPEYYGIMEDDRGQSTRGLLEVITAKWRDGVTGPDLLKFEGRTYRITDEDEDYVAVSEGVTPALGAVTSRSNFEDPDFLPF